jgi:ATP-binding cassette subfamily B protein
LLESKEDLGEKKFLIKMFKNSSFLRLFPFFKPYKSEVLFALIALLVTALMVLFFGKAIKYLVDYAFVSGSTLILNLTLLAFLVAVVVMAIAGYFRSSLINSVAEKVIADLRRKSYAHIIRVSPEFFENTKVGDVITRLTVDCSILYETISANISFFLRNSLLFVGGILLLFLTSTKLSLLSLGLIPLAIAPIIILGKKVKVLAKNAQESLSFVGSYIEESINGIKTIQSYLREEKEEKNFSNFVEKSLQDNLKKIRLKSLMIGLVIAAAFGGIALVLLVGGHDVLNGKITSGELSSFLFYAIVTATSLVSLSQISGQMQVASAAIQRIFELIETKSPVVEEKNLEKFSMPKAVEIKFNGVGFSYPSRLENKVLKDFNLLISAGEKIAIVGASGCGKSTILQLLLRFYDCNEGAITLNGRDVKAMSLNDLRQNFAYISQDCFIFSGSIFENISYAKPDLTKDQIEKIISQNQSLNFINHLPQKLDTFVGEKGIKLSGGERQRIALARAIVKDSPVMIFDEATSALDNQNEQLVNSAMLDFAKDKTVITVTHRLSSIANCNRIIFLKDGEIVEMGTHEELMKQDGSYRKMYEVQL